MAIKEQGDRVRELKTAKAEKSEVDAAVKRLLQLKADFRAESGSDWKPDLLAKAERPRESEEVAAKVRKGREVAR